MPRDDSEKVLLCQFYHLISSSFRIQILLRLLHRLYRFSAYTPHTLLECTRPTQHRGIFNGKLNVLDVEQATCDVHSRHLPHNSVPLLSCTMCHALGAHMSSCASPQLAMCKQLPYHLSHRTHRQRTDDIQSVPLDAVHLLKSHLLNGRCAFGRLAREWQAHD